VNRERAKARGLENIGCEPHGQVVEAVENMRVWEVGERWELVGIMGRIGAVGVGGARGRENNRKVVTSICF